MSPELAMRACHLSRVSPFSGSRTNFHTVNADLALPSGFILAPIDTVRRRVPGAGETWRNGVAAITVVTIGRPYDWERNRATMEQHEACSDTEAAGGAVAFRRYIDLTAYAPVGVALAIWPQGRDSLILVSAAGPPSVSALDTLEAIVRSVRRAREAAKRN